METSPAARSYNHHVLVRKCFVFGLSLFLTSGLLTLLSPFKTEPVSLFRGVFFACTVLFVLVILSGVIACLRMSRMRTRKVAEWHNLFLTQREKAEENTRILHSVLRRLRLWTVVYTVFLMLLAVVGCSSAILAFPDVSVWLGLAVCFVTFLLFYSVLSRLRFPDPKTFFTADETYVDESDFPRLYGLTARAAENFQIDRPVRISIVPGFTAGIGEIGGVYSVQIGILLLLCFSEEELYCTLLHEFAHVKGENKTVFSHSRYNLWLQNSNLSFLPLLTSFPFLAFDLPYQYYYMLYSYASSILVESEADRAMIRFGSPEATGSGLLKLRYFGYYEWEDVSKDFENFYSSETLPPHRVARIVEDFRTVVQQRKSDWDALIPVEILARNASHPTVWMRLESLGLTDAKMLPLTPDHAPAYAEECEKAEKFVDEYLYRWESDSYEASRKERYLDPLKTVEDWKTAGEPLTAEGYADVVEALQVLGRLTESFALCDRALEVLSVDGARFAHYQKALQLLSRYDPEGIGHMYIALENPNFHESGVGLLGEFCCLTGNREELDRYREKAADLAQRQVDHYQQERFLRRKDNLSAETQMPEEMRRQILDFLQESLPQGLDEVYLIRKTVDESFFFTAVVLRFSPDAEEDFKERTFHKTFRFLDTLDGEWDFALFDYFEARGAVNALPESCVLKRSSLN